MNDSNPNLDHWRGVVDQRIAEHERRLLALNGNIAEGAKAINSLALEVGKLSTRIAIYAGLGGFVASGASAVVVYLITGN